MIFQRVILLAICFIWTSGAQANPCPQLAKTCFCNTKLTSVNCGGKKLTSLPEGIPTSVEKLYLSFNDFVSLPQFMFKNLTNLKLLQLDHNKISTVAGFAFGGLVNLETLDLRDNYISSVEENAFSGMTNLEKMYLMTNRIQQIKAGAFAGTETLDYLNLQSNMLTAIPELGKLPRLRSLVLEGNAITDPTFPATFRTCKSLSSIVLSSNKFTKLTNGTFESLRNNSISALKISRNQISQIEASAFSPFATLLSLKLGSNPLTSQQLKIGLSGLNGKGLVSLNIAQISLDGALPSDTFKLLENTTLKFLSMPYNEIAIIPDMAFAELRNLLTLDLSNNKLTQISDNAFKGLIRLNQLTLFKNKLSTAPINLPSSLTQLDLSLNQITVIEGGTFQNLAQLQQLNMAQNQIRTLTQDSFVGLGRLRKLYLCYNQINTLPGKVFSSLVQLTSLELQHNMLLQIQDSTDLFASFSALLYLNLADNQLGTFPLTLFQGMVSLKYLHLERNNIGPVLSKDTSGLVFKGLRKLENLYIMQNGITCLSDPVFQDLASLTFFNATGNKITGWDRDTFKSPVKLRLFDASYNLISMLKRESLLNLHLLQLNLTGNPFACTCDLRWFRDWIKTNATHLPGLANYTCNTPKAWAGKSLLSFDKSKINCVFFTYKMIIIIVVPSVLVPLLVGVLVYRFRWRIWLRWYRITHRRRRHGGRKRTAADGQGDYEEIAGDMVGFDAFISCAEDDKAWVVEHLLPGIDKGELDKERRFGGDFRLYFDDRDSSPGHYKIGNIVDNLEVSRMMIVVLSRHYLNGQNEFELDFAVTMLYEKRLDDIIVVKIDDGLRARKIPKHLYADMQRNRFLEWRNDDVVKDAFKERLKERLHGPKEV